MTTPKKYTFRTAMFDMFMIIITGGFWLFYLIARYLRTH